MLPIRQFSSRFVAGRTIANSAVFLLSDIYTTTGKRGKMLPLYRLCTENLRNVNKNSFARLAKNLQIDTLYIGAFIVPSYKNYFALLAYGEQR